MTELINAWFMDGPLKGTWHCLEDSHFYICDECKESNIRAYGKKDKDDIPPPEMTEITYVKMFEMRAYYNGRKIAFFALENNTLSKEEIILNVMCSLWKTFEGEDQS